MSNQVQELYVFRVRQPSNEDPGHSFWRYVKESPRSDYSPAMMMMRADEATQLSLDEPATLVGLYHKLIRTYGHDDVELVKIKVTTETEVVSMDLQSILEERRRVALSKLTHDDVLALGVEKLATYSKLKFHQKPSDLESIF